MILRDSPREAVSTRCVNKTFSSVCCLVENTYLLVMCVRTGVYFGYGSYIIAYGGEGSLSRLRAQKP